ncbi:MAG: xanthine dehydrogenase molybdopterin binding subunit [Pseudomonadota bacterium]
MRTRIVHERFMHDSGLKHVCGVATYVDDIREPAGTLHIAPGYCRTPEIGRIVRLDLDRVRAAPGVIAVFIAADIPGSNDCSPSLGDDPVLADGEILFHGQVAFAVVARSRIEARKAALLAEFEIEAADPVITADAAAERNLEVLPDYRFDRGDAATALAAARHRLEGRFQIGGQEHFYLEGQAALAEPKEDGDLLVHSSTQHPTEVQHVVARVVGVSHAAVTIEVRRMGGGFGGKESQASQWAALAGLCASLTGRPCKVRLDRDDDMIMTGKRHDFSTRYAVGYDDHGVLESVDTVYLARCGCSADLSLGVVDRTMFHTDNAYFYPNVSILTRRLKTNTVSNTAFRGFGGPQGMLLAERMMDAIAIERGEDPLVTRKRNFYRAGERDITPYGMRVTDNLLHEIVDHLETHCDYWARRQEIARFNRSAPVLRKGLALTPVKFGISFTLKHLNQAGALVHVYADGSVHLNHGGTEMGQGLFVKVAQVVAEEFGIDLHHVKITATTTDKVPNTGPTAASAGSDLNGKAAQAAARIIKQRMTDFAAEAYDVKPDRILFRDNQVFVGNEAIAFGALAEQAYLNRVSLSSTGFYATPGITWDRNTKTGRPFYYFAYGAACSEVTIDTMTGEMRVDRVDILHDVGRSLNPAVDIGQIEGGFVQGMGWLTTEELVWDEAGRLRTHAPSTYKIPTASDVPEAFHVELYESGGNREDTIFRSKAVGEPPVMLANSVFCAINDAIAGLRPGRLPDLHAPATPEAILKAVRSMTDGGD